MNRLKHISSYGASIPLQAFRMTFSARFCLHCWSRAQRLVTHATHNSLASFALEIELCRLNATEFAKINARIVIKANVPQ
jgi:hypothetical protein